MMEQREVVVAEDDDDDFECLEIAINEVSIPVKLIRATNGEMLLEILGEKLPEILFLDILLPLMDGRRCLQEIRSNRRYDLLPIIIYTAIEDHTVIEFTFRNGANLYTMKPSTMDELVGALKKIFSIDWKKSLYYPALPDFVLKS